MGLAPFVNGKQVQLTPGQIREVLDLSPDTFRHWKASLPPLMGRNGHRPCFSHGDLLAMALIRALTEEAGIRIGALPTVSGALFAQCNQHSWTELERSTLILQLAGERVEFLPEPHNPAVERVAIVVPCRSIIAKLRATLLRDAIDDEQGNLRFAPTVVRGGAA